MPTVHRIDGFRVAIHTNDHRPAHVHVIGSDCEVLFDLQCPDGPPLVREIFGPRRLSAKDVNAIAAQLNAVLGMLCAEWSLIHGDD